MQTSVDETIQTLSISRDIAVAAPLDVTFQALLDELGPEGQMPDGTAIPMKLEPWPGWRWFRDLGNNAGHFWGHVQVIKPPTLIELCGPMFMSYPATNFVQYRLIGEAAGTRIRLTHRALGLIPAEHRAGVSEGWDHSLQRTRHLAEQRLVRRG